MEKTDRDGPESGLSVMHEKQLLLVAELAHPQQHWEKGHLKHQLSTPNKLTFIQIRNQIRWDQTLRLAATPWVIMPERSLMPLMAQTPGTVTQGARAGSHSMKAQRVYKQYLIEAGQGWRRDGKSFVPPLDLT